MDAAIITLNMSAATLSLVLDGIERNIEDPAAIRKRVEIARAVIVDMRMCASNLAQEQPRG